MSNHYHAVLDDDRHLQHFGAALADGPMHADLWPGSVGGFIRHPKPRAASAGGGEAETLPGLFGLIPPWSGDMPVTRSTYNARAETAGQKESFRDAWQKAQHCIIPAEAIFETNLRGLKSIPMRISMANGQPMGIAGLWSCSETSAGRVYSYTMLSVNADEHSMMCQLREPLYEKRMVVILPPERYAEWLHAPAQDSMAFMRPYPAEALRCAALVLEEVAHAA